jgi:hypothetical protein
MTSRRADYFKWLLESQNKKSKAFVSEVTASEKAQGVSYLVAERIAQKRKSPTVGKNEVMSARKIILGKIPGQDAVREIENVPLSNRRHTDVLMTRRMMLKRFRVIN